MGRLRIGIDTGGTFTDVVACDEATGELTVTKTPSTPDDPSAGFADGLVKVLALAGAGIGDVAAVSHGTTIATNQLLEGRTGRIGLVTTEGFEFLLEIARQSVPDGYGNSYFWVKPPRIVPASLVRTVRGRLDHTGAELVPFDEDGAAQAARWFRDRGVDVIGVCFLHSYASPGHERRMAEILAREHPGAVVSVSSEVLREYREYERAMTTLLDAAVKPRVAGYLRSVGDRLAALGARNLPLHVMTSGGGVLSAAEVIGRPISTVLSGPAAGALGAALVARAAGADRVLTCDGGGTSTDVAVVAGGEPALTTEGRVGAYPSLVPMVDVVTVGAGGGSVAWVSAEGALKVGPASAGADPGPACYGRGGTEVTVTDAHLLLGRIPPHLLGGEVPLDAGAARRALAPLAARLGLAERDCATGILEVSAWNQANAVRQITVRRGLDLRDFTLVTFGGSGSLLACPLIGMLGVREVLVPPNPGNVSAFGLLTVDVRVEQVRTSVCRHDALDPGAAGAIFAGLDDQARRALAAQGFGAAEQRLARTADLRYYGQAFEVRVAVPDEPAGPPEFPQPGPAGLATPATTGVPGPREFRQPGPAGLATPATTGVPGPRAGSARSAATAEADAGPAASFSAATAEADAGPAASFSAATAEAVVAAFHDAHRALYGYDFRGDSRQHVEWVNFRVTGIGPIRRPALPELAPGDGDPRRALTGTRAVCFGRGEEPVPAGIYARTGLAAGDVLAGPAVIEEYGATVPVHPGYAVLVDRLGNLRLTAGGPAP